MLLPMGIALIYYFFLAMGAIVAGLVLLALYWVFRSIEVVTITAQSPLGYSEAWKRRLLALDGFRACGRFVFRWRVVPLAVIGIACGGFLGLGLGQEHLAWTQSEPVTLTLRQTLVGFIFGGLTLGIPPALMMPCIGEIFFRLVQRCDKHLEPV
jgi:hypothetical protein